MAEPKPFASLSSTLLARKGHARPAMRPQGFGGMIARQTPATDDLGWNDMGHDVPVPAAAPEPAPVVPEVLRQRETLSEAVAAAPVAPVAPAPQPEAESEPVVTVTAALRAAAGKSGKSAFTLRLPAERHLRLRLACAVRHRSAQQLVTEALDRLLDTIPEVEALARQLPDPPPKTTQGK